jgi:hypothetical protein
MRTVYEALALVSDDSFPLACVGESHYQEALERVCGPRTSESVDLEVIASLHLESSNPYDPQAVRVQVGTEHVGYLSRPDAKAFRAVMTAARIDEFLSCRGIIRGGWDRGPKARGPKAKGFYGIYLDLAIYGSKPSSA